ncbi:hypothetical protein H4582DRAFT_1804711 [Lactarius indigo]|nr:hypothetical protein H4582DRAFT_1804711 [Lactarius indigo]
MSHWQPVVIAERDVASVQTQVIVQTFSDRVLVVITQLSKVGTLVLTIFYFIRSIRSDFLCRSKPPCHQPLPLPKRPHPTMALYHPCIPSVDLTYLFGHAPSSDHQTLYSSYAAQVATLVWTSERYAQIGSPRTPVVVGVALKAPRSSERDPDADRATFLQIMDLVREVLGTV